MKRKNITQIIQRYNISLIRLFFLFGFVALNISCEMEDDIPPPSAYVEPEPVEGCVQIEGVPELAEGIDFECLYPAFETFGGNDAGSITVDPVDNPYKEGINTSDKVIMVTQTAGVEGWAGLFFDLASKVDFSEEQTIKVKVYSPAVGQTVLLKLEDSSDSSLNTEISTTTTVAEEWEELSFTFSPGDSDKYERMVLFFNFNGDKDAATVHYFDDIVIGEAGPAEDPMKLPVTFDDPLVNYTVVPFGAEGTAFEIVANPELSGSNDTESQVGAVNKTGAAFEGITFNLSEALDLSGDNKTLGVKVYSEVAYTVLLKLETGVNDERSNEVSADHGGTGWETLTFDFATDATTSYQSNEDPGGDGIVPNGQYDQISLFLDFNGSAAGTFYVDDLVHEGDDGGTSAAPTAAASNPTDDAGNVQSIFSDAYTDPAGINYYPAWGQSTTFEMLDFDGNEVIKYGNANYEGIDFGESLDLTSYNTLKIDVWSADYTSIQIFLISPGPVEKSVSLDVTSNQWNTIEIPLEDFASQGLDISDIFQIKFVVEESGGAFYIDNLYFSSEVAAECIAETEENIDPANGPINWTFKTDDLDHEFDQFGDITTDIVSNPKTDGINTSCFVQKVTKSEGCQTWSGLGTAIPTAIDFTTTDMKVFKLKVLAQDQLAAVTLRLEREPYPDVEPAEERIAEITEVGVWQELTFDFSDVDDKTFRSIIIYFERDVACDGDVYYFDDLKQVAGGNGGGSTGSTKTSFPVDFETAANGGAAANWSVFENVDNPALEIISNPDMTGNTSSTVAKFTARQGGEQYAGTETVLESPFTLDASNSTVKIWVWKSVISDVGIKFANAAGGSTGEIKVANTKTNEWEELTFDFSGVIGDPNNTDITNLVVFPDFQARSQENVAYFDNITLNSSTGGGSGGGTTSGTFGLPIDFEGGVEFNLGENSVPFEIVTNPKQSGINNTSNEVGKVSNQGGQYEALTFLLDQAIDFSGSNKTITMKVYSEVAYQVLFKLETGVNGERANEVEVSHGGTGWEELTFDFGNSARTSYISNDDPGGAAFVPDGQYDEISIFLDFAGFTAGDFYIDDIKQN